MTRAATGAGHAAASQARVAARDAEALAHAKAVIKHWITHPVGFVQAVMGIQPDPWQCDVLDAVVEYESVAVRAAHGCGKTSCLAWLTLWFAMTRPQSRIPTTAPTFNKQVCDVLWAELHLWWGKAQRTSPWLTEEFGMGAVRFYHRQHPYTWFAVGIASSEPINIEGYHAPHLLAVFDEAKGIPSRTWEAVHGMRTTQEAKLVVASTPGGPRGEFYKVFTQYRQTWKSCFVIHPEALRGVLQPPRPEAPRGSRGGTYYSARIRPEWIEERRLEWGFDSPVFIARCIGDFPTIEGDVLIPYKWLSEAEDREDGIEGPRVIACDVARYGRDRTILLVIEGGTVLAGEAIARVPAESTAPEVEQWGEGDDPARPRYRALDVTADACVRLRRQWAAEAIAVDDTGLGGGLTDILRRRGERVQPINFGAAPTDLPKTAEQRAWKERRHLLPSNFANLKAQMGWSLRAGFELGQLGLGRLAKPFLDALIAQSSMVKQQLDIAGRIRVVDPDETADESTRNAIGDLEGKRSPDHFHALVIGWWATRGAPGMVAPQSGVPTAHPGLPRDVRVGTATRVGQLGPAPRAAPSPAMRVAGQAAHVSGYYERRR